MRYLVGLVCVLALGVMGCSERDGTFRCGSPDPKLTADGREVLYRRHTCETVGDCWIDCSWRLVHSRVVAYEVETRSSRELPFEAADFDVSGDGRIVVYYEPEPDSQITLLEIYDRSSGDRASVDISEFGFLWGSAPPRISGDGQIVAFTVAVDGDPSNPAIYVYDRLAKQLERSATEPDAFSPSLSNDGRFLAYATSPSISEPPDAIYVLDRANGQTTLVSVNSDGETADGPSFEPWISGDARFVVFRSSATNLSTPPPNPTVGAWIAEVYRHDRETEMTSLISRDADSGDPSGTSTGGPIEGEGLITTKRPVSTDGRFVVYGSNADNIVPLEGEASVTSVYRYDAETDRNTRVSVNSLGDAANRSSAYPSISDDGRFIAFSTNATNLDPDDQNSVDDVYLHDVDSGETTWVSR
jgi:Tol biopolymer transport system component